MHVTFMKLCIVAKHHMDFILVCHTTISMQYCILSHCTKSCVHCNDITHRRQTCCSVHIARASMSGALSSPGRCPLGYCIDDTIEGTAPKLHTHLHGHIHCLGTNTNAWYIGQAAWPHLARNTHGGVCHLLCITKWCIIIRDEDAR